MIIQMLAWKIDMQHYLWVLFLLIKSFISIFHASNPTRVQTLPSRFNLYAHEGRDFPKLCVSE